MRYLLDTSALLAHYRQEAGWEAVHTLLETDAVEVILASVSLAEFGRRLRDLGATEEEIADILNAYELLMAGIEAIGATTAKAAFSLGLQTPQRLPLIDALIAAVAQENEAILVHRDEHMRAIPQTLVNQQDLSLP